MVSGEGVQAVGTCSTGEIERPSSLRSTSVCGLETLQLVTMVLPCSAGVAVLIPEPVADGVIHVVEWLAVLVPVRSSQSTRERVGESNPWLNIIRMIG